MSYFPCRLVSRLVVGVIGGADNGGKVLVLIKDIRGDTLISVEIPERRAGANVGRVCLRKADQAVAPGLHEAGARAKTSVQHDRLSLRHC